MECMSNQFLSNTLKTDLHIDRVTVTSSGTSALFHLLESMHLKKVDEVVLSSFNCEKILLPLKLLRINYKFVDISLKNIAPTLSNYKNAVTKKTKVIIHSHLWGYVSKDFVDIADWCKKNKIILIEDIASSYNLSYKGKKLGKFGEYCFGSFNHTKPLDLGRGGFCSIDINDENRKIPFSLKIANSNFYNNTMKFLRKINSRILLKAFLNVILIFRFNVKENIAFSQDEVKRAQEKLKCNKKNCQKISQLLRKSRGVVWANNDEKYTPRMLLYTDKKNQIVSDRSKMNMWIGIDFSHPLHYFYGLNNVLPNTEKAARQSVQIVTDTENSTLSNVVCYLK